MLPIHDNCNDVAANHCKTERIQYFRSADVSAWLESNMLRLQSGWKNKIIVTVDITTSVIAYTELEICVGRILLRFEHILNEVV